MELSLLNINNARTWQLQPLLYFVLYYEFFKSTIMNIRGYVQNTDPKPKFYDCWLGDIMDEKFIPGYPTAWNTIIFTPRNWVKLRYFTQWP